MYRFIFVFIILLSACEQEVEIDLAQSFKPEIAISSFFSDNEPINIFVTLTQPAYSEEYKRVSVSNAWLEDGLKNKYPLEIDKHFFNIDLFSSEEINFSNGNPIKLIIESEEMNSTLIAEDTIPHSATFKNMKITPIDNELYYHISGIIVPPKITDFEDTYYEVVLYVLEKNDVEYHNLDYLFSHNHLITKEEYYPGVLLLGSVGPPTLLWRNNSKENFYIDFYYDTPSSAWNASTGYRLPEHYLKIELRTVSKAYFSYKTSLYRQQYAIEGDFMYGLAPPTTVKSNVKGGTGIFAAYSKVDTVLHVKPRVIK